MSNPAATPLVSVVMPMYNQRQRLDATMRSICRQTYKNLEVIIVNDGSTDNSPSIARAWAARDSRVRVIDKHNEGAILARRDGYRQAKGEFITFVDSDDLLPTDAIAILAGHIIAHDVDLVIGSMTRKLGFIKQSHIDRFLTFPFDTVVAQPDLFDKYYLGFFRNNIIPVSMCARLYRKSALDRAWDATALFDEQVTLMGEDQFFNLKLFPYLRSMYRTDETVYIYRYGGGTNRFNPNFTQLFVSSDKRLQLLDQYNYDAGYEPLFAEYVACLYFHASRLISCQVADRQGVIDFFRDEVEHRQLMPRLMDYYREHGTTDERVRLLLTRDYDAMYRYANDMIQQHRASFKSKLRSLAINILKRFP